MSADIRTWVDPVPVARDEGRKQGQRDMRDRICQQIASFAAMPNQPAADELWRLLDHVKGLEVR